MNRRKRIERAIDMVQSLLAVAVIIMGVVMFAIYYVIPHI